MNIYEPFTSCDAHPSIALGQLTPQNTAWSLAGAAC